MHQHDWRWHIFDTHIIAVSQRTGLLPMTGYCRRQCVGRVRAEQGFCDDSTLAGDEPLNCGACAMCLARTISAGWGASSQKRLSKLWHRFTRIRDRQKNLAQEHNETANERDHGHDKKQADDFGEIDRHEGIDKCDDDQQTDKQSAENGACHGGIDQPQTPAQIFQFVSRRHQLSQTEFVQLVFENADAIHDACEAVRQHAHQGTDCRQKKNRRNRQRDDVSDLIDVGLWKHAKGFDSGMTDYVTWVVTRHRHR